MKYYGRVAYGINAEVRPGVWKEAIVLRNYRGDVTRISRRLQSGDQVNDDMTISNEIKIVADAFAYQNFQNIRYIEWMGTKWKVNTATVDRPRITLEIGGVYNGNDGPST